MASFVDVASRVLAQSERRAEIAAQNVANISTPGYKRRIGFSKLIDQLSLTSDPTVLAGAVTDFAAGKQIETGNPFDLALTGPGFFVIQGESGLLYTRQGQFKRESDGRLVTLQGLAVQAQGGGDIILKNQDFKVANDGTITENGEPTAKLAVIDFADRSAAVATDGGGFTAPAAALKDIDAPAIRQGALEASNVSTGDDMVAVMEAVRRAETAQRLVNIYDDLMGRALSTFGQT